jgi:hypothetical protein
MILPRHAFAARSHGLSPVAGAESFEVPLLPAPMSSMVSHPPLSSPSGADFKAPSTLNRWSLSTWAFVRRGSAEQLAAAGTLGASQAGARATYALTDRLALSARLYSPISRLKGAEAVLGIEVQPLRTVPVRILAERRQAIGRDGRSAFALLAHGGASEQRVLGPVRLDAYGQAGVVGLRSRHGFVDGAARLGVNLTEDLKLGLGAWGAAQPGATRLDLGPQASYRLPVLGGHVNASLEWRARVAGDARPGSGPALTLSTDF